MLFLFDISKLSERNSIYRQVLYNNSIANENLVLLYKLMWMNFAELSKQSYKNKF